METRGIEPPTYRMRSDRSAPELRPQGLSQITSRFLRKMVIKVCCLMFSFIHSFLETVCDFFLSVTNCEWFEASIVTNETHGRPCVRLFYDFDGIS